MSGLRRPDERRGDVQVEPEEVVRVVACLDHRQAREPLGPEGEPDPFVRLVDRARSSRTRRRSASRRRTAPPRRVPRRSGHRRAPGRPRSRARWRSRSPPAGRTRSRPRVPSVRRAADRLRAGGRSGRRAVPRRHRRSPLMTGFVEVAQEVALPVVAEAERQTAAHRLDVGVLHRSDGVVDDGQGGPERSEDVLGGGRVARPAHADADADVAPSRADSGPIQAVSSSASGAAGADRGHAAEDLLRPRRPGR